MNLDHQDAVIAYARHYGGYKNPQKAEMIAVTPTKMELAVDGDVINISFDHTLTDSEDAHKTLVAMLRSIPKEGC